MNKAVGVAVSLFAFALMACAGSSSESGSTTDDSLTAGPALESWVDNPQIVAVRDQVAAVEALSLRQERAPECARVAHRDGSGMIRKIVDNISGAFGVVQTTYYGERGEPLFVFSTMSGGCWQATTRYYYDVNHAEPFFSVRETSAKPGETACHFEEDIPQGLSTPEGEPYGIASAEVAFHGECLGD